MDCKESFLFNSYQDDVSCADVAQLAEQLICNQQVIGSSPIIGLLLSEYDFKEAFNRISRGGAVWKLVGLITRRS